MPTDVRLQAVLSLKDNFTRELKNAEGGLRGFASQAKVAGVALAGIGVAVAGKALRDFAEFDKSIRNIGTLLGENAPREMERFKQGIRDISRVIPKDANELGAAAYDVVSAGISDTSEALDVLKSSSKLAVAGLSDTKEAVNILTSAINVYGDESHNSNRIAEILFKTVKNGKTTIAELSQGFGKVAGIAKETGISLEDLQASTAALTTTGISAAESQTALKAVISNILKPTTDATEAAKKLGIEFDLTALQSKGLAGLLAEITDKAGGNKQALADLFGSVEAANAIFSLTSEDGGESFRRILEDINAEGGDLEQAVKVQTDSISGQWQLMKNDLNEASAAVGEGIAKFLMPAIKDFRMLVTADLGTTFVDRLDEQFPGVFKWLNDFKHGWDLLSGDIAGGTRAVVDFFTTLNSYITGQKGPGSWLRSFSDNVRNFGASLVPDFQPRAAGGTVQAGQSYIVGEKRPELFTPNSPGLIHPDASQQTSPNMTMNIYGPVIRKEEDLNTLANEVEKTLSRRLRLSQVGV